MELGLLLVDAETLEPVVRGDLPSAALAQVPHEPPDISEAEHLFSDTRHLDDLVAQRWGVIVPEEAGADTLLARIAPLIEARAGEQGIKPEEVRIYRVAKQADPARWIQDNLRSTDAKRPRYLLLLGDLDQVSFELQRKLSDFSYYPGRLAFDEPAHYEAYAKKVLSWERPRGPRTDARVVMMTARTQFGGDAPDHGYVNLMRPAFDLATEKREEGDGYAFTLEELSGDPPVSLESLLAVARATQVPTVLWTMSHGQGVSGSYEDKRRSAGAPKFAGGRLTAAHVADGPFLPGGIWFLFACFGAGTPSRSVYWHWIKRLLDDGEKELAPRDLSSALKFLPKDGEDPFVAAVPKAALASAEGPVAVLGHVDLAWIHSYKDLTGAGADPRERFLRVPYLLADPSNRCRVGRAVALFRKLDEIDSSLADMHDLHEEAIQKKMPSKVDPIQHGRLWMHRQDLANYMLLGDPAVRLPSHAAS